MPNTVSSASIADVEEIQVEYDEATGGVTVTPQAVDKGRTVRFKDPKGGKLRIVFISPTGSEIESVLDTESVTMTIGGIYHFNCFFTLPGAQTEIIAKHGAVLEVYPPRP